VSTWAGWKVPIILISKILWYNHGTANEETLGREILTSIPKLAEALAHCEYCFFFGHFFSER
jgi:hypothetical protein